MIQVIKFLTADGRVRWTVARMGRKPFRGESTEADADADIAAAIAKDDRDESIELHVRAVRDLGKCATCRFWGHSENGVSATCGKAEVTIQKQRHPSSLAVAYCADGGPDSYLETQALFGCVQWEAK